MHTQGAYLFLVGNLSKFPAKNAPNLPSRINLQIVSTSVAAERRLTVSPRVSQNYKFFTADNCALIQYAYIYKNSTICVSLTVQTNILSVG